MSDTSCPPREMPPHLADKYTMNGPITVREKYYDGTCSETGPQTYTKEKIDECLAGLAAQKTFYYGMTDRWLRQALERFPIRNMSVAVKPGRY